MTNTLHTMSHLEKYNQKLELLQLYPHFNSEQDGMNVMYETIQKGEVKRFTVYGKHHDFYRCYWQREELVCVRDFSIYPHEMWRSGRLAAQELGEFLLNQ